VSGGIFGGISCRSDDIEASEKAQFGVKRLKRRTCQSYRVKINVSK
jgi:hypothetical protein